MEGKMETKFRLVKSVMKGLCFWVYLAALFYLTILNREPEPQRMAWTALFGSYRRAWEEKHEFILWGLIDNVVMMVPLGILLPWLNGRIRFRHTMFLAFALTVFIESTQYITRLGYFDVDDIWNNLWGTAIGYGLCRCRRELAGVRQGGKKIRYAVLFGSIFPLAVFVIFFAVFLWLGIF